MLEDGPAVHVVGGRDALGRFEREAAGEDAQATQHCLFAGIGSVPSPCIGNAGRASGPMAGDSEAARVKR